MPELPPLEELKRLPLRAIVAYAARCARRVLPLVEASSIPTEKKLAVSNAIDAAEEIARGGFVRGPAAIAHQAGLFDQDFSHERNPLSFNFAVIPNDIGHAARTAVLAAYTAAATDVANPTAPDATEVGAHAADLAADAARSAIHALSSNAPNVAASISRASTRDVEELLKLQLGRLPELGPPIDPSEEGPLGPLWPNGNAEFLEVVRVNERQAAPPATWQPEPQDDGIVLAAEVSEFAEPGEVGEALASLCYALNAYHIAAGGNGLVLDGWEIRVTKASPAEAT